MAVADGGSARRQHAISDGDIPMGLSSARPAGLAMALLTAALPAAAVPYLDLKPYPPAAAGQQRWVFQLNPLLRPSPDAGISANPADWRVQLIVGRELEVDCNTHHYAGQLRRESVPGWGYPVVRLDRLGPLIATRRACPDQAPERRFVSLAGEPFLLPYNVSLPVVVYVPEGVQVRWRLWKAEAESREAAIR
jgi:ecotin